MFEEIIHCTDMDAPEALCGEVGKQTDEEDNVTCWLCAEILRVGV